MKKSIFAALALLALTGCATRLPEDELRLTRERLDKYLFNEGNLTQSEMTILSTYLLRLARMEQYMIEYRIWNQPGYEKIEKQFMADCKRWDKKLEEESKKPMGDESKRNEIKYDMSFPIDFIRILRI